jgi:hypothetical protein
MSGAALGAGTLTSEAEGVASTGSGGVREARAK